MLVAQPDTATVPGLEYRSPKGTGAAGQQIFLNSFRHGSERLAYAGAITLTEDLQDIEDISPMGYVHYTYLVGKNKKRLVFESDASGDRFIISYYENEEGHSYRPLGEQWRRQIMPGLIARSGIGLEARVQQVYQQQGTEGVLAEADKIAYAEGKQHMLHHLLLQPGLKPAEAALALQYLDRYATSDEQRSYMLDKVPAPLLENDALSHSYLVVAQGISSDAELRKSLFSLLQAPNLSRTTVNKAMHVAGKMPGHEKAKVLQQLSGSEQFNQRHYKAAFSLISGMTSDHDKQEAIFHILGKHRLSPAQYQELLPAVSQIHSDQIKSKVLRGIAPGIPKDATAARTDYQLTARTIYSAYEYRMAMDALP